MKTMKWSFLAICITACSTSALAVAPPAGTLSVSPGNYQFGFNFSVELGKYQDGSVKSNFQPIRLFDCQHYFTKSYRVKDSGSKWRSYRVEGVGRDWDKSLSSFALQEEYLPHTGNGNTQGRVDIYTNNNGNLNYDKFENVIDAPMFDTYISAIKESMIEGWPYPPKAFQEGINFNVRCKYEDAINPDYKPNQKKTWSVEIVSFGDESNPIDKVWSTYTMFDQQNEGSTTWEEMLMRLGTTD